MSQTTFLKRPRRGLRPESDVRPESQEQLGAGLMECLRVKGYCVINDLVSDGALKEAAAACRTADFYQPAVLVQEGLLGMEGSNRIAKFGLTPVADVSPSGMGPVDKVVWRVATALGPYQYETGFRCATRSQLVVHEASDPSIDETDLEDDEANDWAAVFLARKIAIMVFLGPDKGVLELTPYDEDANPAELTTVQGLVIAVRTDQINTKFYTRGSKANYVAAAYMIQTDILRMHRNKAEEHVTPAARDLDNWITSRLREIKEQTKADQDWDQLDIPRNLISAANRAWCNRQTQAVRGVAIRSPSCWESEVFFLALTSGTDVITEVPLGRWEHADVYDSAPNSWQQQPPKTNCKHASFCDGIELFDAKLFGLSVAEVKGMDPSQRQVLETTYDALFRSGMKKSTLTNSSCGMYVGLGQTEWNYAERSADMGIFGATGGAPSICAGRLSFCLGCKGASLAIDTEAASSLSAVFWAAEAVEKKGTGQIQDLACGIGVSLILAKAWWPAHSAAGFLSPEGRCLTFDATATGHARMEATGCAVMRNKADVVDGQEVVDDNQPLVGTIVGGATANNGKTSTLSAPSGPAEQAVLLDACRKSGIMPFDVDVVEVHGTSKLISDAVEVASLGKALRGGTGETDEMMQLGTMKTNAGNCMETAGVAGFVKMLHSIRWGIVTPNVHLRQLNPHLDLQECPVLMGDENQAMGQSVVFAGVSAHGFGGTNVHIQVFGGIDEEVRPAPEPTPEDFRSRLSYWPGGGGDLGGVNRPRRGYFIVGSWNDWEAQQMESEGDGCFSFMMTLGETLVELFRIHIDGSDEKVLHPMYTQVTKGSAVFGPDPSQELDQECHWVIDARPLQASSTPEQPALTDGSSGAQIVAHTGDTGVAGDRYKIRLHIAGKWRTVMWEKVQAS